MNPSPSPSPEIEAVVRRVLAAWQRRDFDTVSNLFSVDAALRVTGFDDDERWPGREIFLSIFRTQAEEWPEWKEDVERVEAFEDGSFGWASLFGTVITPETRSPIRHSAVLRLESGAWRIIQWMNAIPVPNRQIFGVELTTTLDHLVASVLDDGADFLPMAGAEGTMTLVFTDMVDSTALAESMGDNTWTETVRDHESAIRRITTSGGGRVVKLLGDGSMLAFESARGAVRAAIEIQASTHQAPFSVRIGAHTGDVIRTGSDFFGTTVNKAARIAATAGAGEIMVSSTTAEMIGSMDGIRVDDVGLVALKGLSGSHHVFAVHT